MTNQFSLANLLQSAGDRMASELREQLIAHRGELGADRENIVRRFLAAYLPKRFEVSTGFAFDASGKISKQLDIVIADSRSSHRFETAGGIRYYPCESIVAVGQVRSSLTSRRELFEALDNLESAKVLDRSAGGKAFDPVHKEDLSPLVNHLHQIFTFLLITDKALRGDSTRDALMDHVITREPHVWPNVIFAMNNYLLTFCCELGVCPNPMDARGIALQSSHQSELLVQFFLLLGGAIEAIRVSSFPYWEYLRAAHQWNAEVIHSTEGVPPPLLSSLVIHGMPRNEGTDD